MSEPVKSVRSVIAFGIGVLRFGQRTYKGRALNARNILAKKMRHQKRDPQKFKLTHLSKSFKGFLKS